MKILINQVNIQINYLYKFPSFNIQLRVSKFVKQKFLKIELLVTLIRFQMLQDSYTLENDIISYLLFGGMSKQNVKRTTRSSKQNSAPKKQQYEQKQIQAPKNNPKNAGQKKPMQQKSLFSMGFKKQQNQVIPEPIELRYTVKQLLKHRNIQQIIQKCPKIKILYDLLCSKPFMSQKLVLSCLDKYFHGNTTSLWINKYAPTSFNQLFQSNFAQKIEEWIKDFYYFRKQATFDQQHSFIDDQPQQSYSKSLQMRMREYGWNCRALVLKGRSGVGKASLLTAIAKSMNIRCFEYASDVDQLQKMKQMVEGSQSQCVDKYHNKKKQQQNNQLIKQNSFITTYLSVPTVKKQSLQTKQPKRLQIFRNFSQYFAPSDRVDKQAAQDSYFRHLFDSINKSQIPYVLTSNKLQFMFRQKHLNQKFSKFDEIDFEQSSVEDFTYFYWLIYQIQINLNLCTWVKVKKEQLFEQLNRQFANLQFKIVDNLHLIRQLVIRSNKKPLYIAKHLQFMVHSRIKALPSQKQDYDDKIKLGFLQQSIKKVGDQILQNITSDGLLNNIQWKMYQKKEYQQSNPLQMTAADDQIQKSSKSPMIQQKQFAVKRPNLKQIIRNLDIAVIEDHKIFQNQYFYYKRNERINLINEDQDSFQNIPINIHKQAKRKILKNIKRNIGYLNDQKQKWEKKGNPLRVKLKQQQMYYLPLLFTPRRPVRGLRKAKKTEKIEQTLSKIMNSRELEYMEKFGKLFFAKSSDQS